MHVTNVLCGITNMALQTLVGIERWRVLWGKPVHTRVNVRIDGHSDELWWGVDTFVLPAARGEGIGKKLQKKLLDDFSKLLFCVVFKGKWIHQTQIRCP